MVQASQTVMASENSPFALCVGTYKNNTKSVVLKYNKITGRSWLLNKDKFEKIPEKKSIPRSNYTIVVMPVKNGWFATRIDTKSGKTWRLKNRMWVKM
jgi:hypothetical protein